MRLTTALACALLASFAAPPRALATPSFTQLHEPCEGSDCVAATARRLSPDGTLITGTLSSGNALEWSREGVRWEDVGGTWTQGPGVGAAGSNTTISSFVHVGLSATNLLVYETYAFDGGVETWIAPGAAEPASRLPGAGCPLYDAMLAAQISADGSTVIGTLDCVFDGFVEGAYRWTEATGAELLGPPGSGSSARAVSDDGRVVTGIASAGPFVWTAANGYEIWPATISGLFPSGDGATLVGTELTASGPEAFVWDETNGFTHLGDLAGGAFDSRAFLATRDGSLVAGASRSALGSEPFAWTREIGLVGVGFAGIARAVTETGLVLGSATLPGDDDLFLWNPRNGWLRSVESLLRDADVDVPATGLEGAIGISDDARVVAGNALGLPWVATLPPLGQLCDVEMSQATYANGNDVVIASLRFTNNEPSARPVRLRLQLTLPFGITVNVLNLGASGGFYIPANFDNQLGPITMFTLQPGQPRGNFSWRCALEEPGTGAIIAEDVAAFVFE